MKIEGWEYKYPRKEFKKRVKQVASKGQINLILKELAGNYHLWITSPEYGLEHFAEILPASKYVPLPEDLKYGNDWEIVLRDADAKNRRTIYSAIPSFLHDHFDVNDTLIKIYPSFPHLQRPIAVIIPRETGYQLVEPRRRVPKAA